jgi:SagB-type dehydrogenase family enzyme
MHPVLAYHERTKHSWRSVRTGGHRLDWGNEPSKFKRYRGVDLTPLPPFTESGVTAHQAVRRSARGEGSGAVRLEDLSPLLHHAAGVIREVRGAFGSLHFRTYASAGALYPNEVYVAAGQVEDLEPGLYHYRPDEHALGRLRSGDVRRSLGLGNIDPGAITLMITGIPWRTAWKYTARGFRHLYWDAGMMVANLLAAAASRDVQARLVLGFVDAEADAALGLDGRTEFALCAVTLGEERENAAAAAVPPLRLETEALSARPRSDPVIEEARAAVALADAEAVQRFRETSVGGAAPVDSGPGDPSLLSDHGFEQVVRRRGSSRDLARASMPAGELAAILAESLAGLPTDWSSGLVHALVIANALDGSEPGAYSFDDDGLRLLRAGSFRDQAGYLCLEQKLGADAAAVIFLMADLERAVDALGGRGYAAAQLEAGVIAGRLYLASYAQCLGASGITFYDDEIRSFFGTRDEPMMTVVVGPEGRRASIRRCRESIGRPVEGD